MKLLGDIYKSVNKVEKTVDKDFNAEEGFINFEFCETDLNHWYTWYRNEFAVLKEIRTPSDRIKRIKNMCSDNGHCSNKA
jgi:hypothetical protein